MMTLARGDQFNPLSMEMIAALQAKLDSIATDESVRVVVLAAQGQGFCAGHDLREIREHATDQEWIRRLFDSCNRMMITLTELPQPVIARVHGIATAAGCQLVSMCDLVVASDAAQFALPGVNIGLFCTTPAVGVVRSIGRKRTMEMLLTGHPIDAATALEWGLVNRVVPAERLDDALKAFVDTILARSAEAIRIGKHAFYGQAEQPLGAAYCIAARAMEDNLRIEDAREGIDAFLEKRQAKWRSAG